MLDSDEVHLAVDLHRRSYNLLRWLSTAISKGVIRFERAHDYMDEADVAKDWIEGHYMNLPPGCRPTLDQLAPFARFFATYLSTSFELVETPGEQLVTSCGCTCPMCSYFVGASHLRPKKLSRRDKERATKMKVYTVQQLAREHNIALDQQQAEQLINSPDTAMDVSLIAYGQQLVERIHGRSQGPAVLALWREIAWDKKGSPKKNFELDPEAILSAEKSVVERIAG